MTFYEILRTTCEKKQTSPSAVVTALGMSKSNITKWKSGRSPRLNVVIKIADHLGVSATSLVRGVDIIDEEGEL